MAKVQKTISSKSLLILGSRGIPAAHSGFETFAEKLALYLNKKKWKVTVYNQEKGSFKRYISYWRGIKRIHFQVPLNGPLSTIIFDLFVAIDALSKKGLLMTLGYNSALFNILNFAKGQINLINMDGIEWKRGKWNSIVKFWFWLNELFAQFFGTWLIADHPEIERHVKRFGINKNVVMLPYGAERNPAINAKFLDENSLTEYGYGLVIARMEQENSIFEIVKTFSNKKRDFMLIVLGKLEPDKNSYHKKIIDCASSEVKFLGAIFEQENVNALRKYSKFYIHGHTVGGTNPSLIEAMSCNCQIIAHDNIYNKWVLGNKGRFFSSEKDLEEQINVYISDISCKMNNNSAKERFLKNFTWDKILLDYEKFLEKFINNENKNNIN